MRLLSRSFSGTEVAKRQMAGFQVVESVHRANEHVPWHTHQWPYFTFVLRGGYTEECQDNTWEITEGDVVLHGAGEAHADRIHADGSCLLNLEFAQSWLDRVGGFGARLDARFTANGGYLLELGKRLHRELWNQERSSALCIEGLALELIAATADDKVRPSRNAVWLRRALDYLHENFRDSPTLNDVAAAAGVHPVHLAREFRRKQGTTVGGYIRKLRIDLACRELASSEQPIVEIAVAAGFCDHSHMTRVFREETGITPTAFRRLRRRG
jgi:AraC family transcriptional regulator